MRAVVYRDQENAVAVEDVHLDAPGPLEVSVQIAAAGVCHSDLHVRNGEWLAPAPLVMGHEGSGVVLEVGEQVDWLAPGDHVVLSWVAPCGECRYCRAGHEARCEVAANVVAAGGVLQDGSSRLHDATGTTLHHYLGVSSFAEQVVVPASGAIKIRDDAPLDEMALVGCAIATGVGAVRNTAQVEPGATVAVIGCGGVGLSVIQGAKLVGASTIIAVDILPDKLALAQLLGATHTIDGSKIDAATGIFTVLPDGADYVFDAIGKTQTTEQAIAALALGGAAVIVGLPPAGAQARFEPLVLAEGDQRILGSNYGSVRPAIDIPKLVDEVMDGRLDLTSMISGKRPLDDASDALDELASGSALRTLLVPHLAL